MSVPQYRKSLRVTDSFRHREVQGQAKREHETKHTAADTETASPQEVAIIAVRLARHLPTTEGTKLALWRICSRLLLNRFALTPDELDAFYATAISDKPDEPGKTLRWLQKRLSQSKRQRTTKRDLKEQH